MRILIVCLSISLSLHAAEVPAPFENSRDKMIHTQKEISQEEKKSIQELRKLVDTNELQWLKGELAVLHGTEVFGGSLALLGAIKLGFSHILPEYTIMPTGMAVLLGAAAGGISAWRRWQEITINDPRIEKLIAHARLAAHTRYELTKTIQGLLYNINAQDTDNNAALELQLKQLKLVIQTQKSAAIPSSHLLERSELLGTVPAQTQLTELKSHYETLFQKLEALSGHIVTSAQQKEEQLQAPKKAKHSKFHLFGSK